MTVQLKLKMHTPLTANHNLDSQMGKVTNDKLMSVFHASVLLLVMNFIITLPK